MTSRTLRALALAAGLAAAPARAEVEPERILLSSEPGNFIELTGDERRLVVEGLAGDVRLRGGKDGEIRYMAVEIDDLDATTPVELWQEGSTLRLSPPAGETPRLRRVEISVPAAIDVELRTSDSAVEASNLRGALLVEGAALGLVARNLSGATHLRLRDSTIEALQLARTTIEGEGLQLGVNGAGDVDLNVGSGSRGRLEKVGALRGEIAGTQLEVAGASGAVDLQGTGGSLRLAAPGRGVQLRMRGTALDVAQTQGAVDIDADGVVQLADIGSGLTLLGYGADVQGQRVRGTVEVELHGGSLSLQHLVANARLTGDGITVRLSDAQGQVHIETTSSTIVLENVQAPVSLVNDFGDVTVRQAATNLIIDNHEGNVHITGLAGPLELQAYSPMVEVEWTALAHQQDSRITNGGGDVRIAVPREARTRLEVEAEGTIESEVAELRVGPGGGSAVGALGRAQSPTIRVVSGGDVWVGNRLAQ